MKEKEEADKLQQEPELIHLQNLIDKLREKEEAGDVEEADKLRAKIDKIDKTIQRGRPLGVTLCAFLIALYYSFTIVVTLVTLPYLLADAEGLTSLFLNSVILFIIGRIIYGLLRMERNWGWLGAEILSGFHILIIILEVIMGGSTWLLGDVAINGVIFIYLFSVKDTFIKTGKLTRSEYLLKYALIKNEGIAAFTIAKNTFKKFEDLVEGQKFEEAVDMIVAGETYKPLSSEGKKEWIEYMKNNPDQRLFAEVLGADYMGPGKIFVKFHEVKPGRKDHYGKTFIIKVGAEWKMPV